MNDETSTSEFEGFLFMEIWKEIKGYEGRYIVSNMGKVRSKDYTHIHDHGKTQFFKGKELAAGLSNTGYKRVELNMNGKGKKFSIHRLVAINFIPNPLNKPQVNHIDGNKLNNNVNNLEWVTQSENTLKAYKNGQVPLPIGEDSHDSILTEKQVIRIRHLLKNTSLSQYKIASLFDVSRSCINSIKHRYTWKHLK